MIRPCLLFLVLLLAGCTPTASSVPTPSPVERRSANQAFTIAVISLPANASPENTVANYTLFSTLFDSLVRLDRLSNPVPWSAEKWEQASPVSWRFTVKKGLTFSNGDPLTAADVEYTARNALTTRSAVLGLLGSFSDVKLIDEWTVEFTTRVPDAAILPGLSGLWILPKKYHQTVGRDGFAGKPIGSGPYELAEYRSSDLAKVTKRSAEHPHRKSLPSALAIRALAEGTSMVAGFRTGDLDVLAGQLNPEHVELLKPLDAQINIRYSGVNFALFSQPESRTRGTPLTDRRVRLALNYAIDREALSNSIFRGYGKPVGQFSVPESMSWDENVKPFPYDPAQAKRLLAEAGYPNGFRLPAGIEFTPTSTTPQVATAVQGYLRDIGVESPLNSLEIGVFLDKFFGRNNQTKGDLFMVTTQTSSAFGVNQFMNHLCTRQWWCIPEFDRYYEQVIGEPDLQKRATLLRAAMKLLNDEVAHIELLAVPDFVVTQPRVKGFVWEASTSLNFENLYRVE